MNLKKEYLIEDEIYYHDSGNYGWLFIHSYIEESRIKGKACISTKNTLRGSFDRSSYSNIHNGNIELRLATPEEKHWLNECIRLDKYIEKTEALRSVNESTELDKWLAQIKVLNLDLNSLSDLISGDSGKCPYYIYEQLEGHNSKNKAKILYDLWNNKQPEFIVGRWYKTDMGSYVKYKKTTEGIFKSSEDIMYSSRLYSSKDGSFGSIKNVFTEASLEEIQQYLPNGHKDLENLP